MRVVVPYAVSAPKTRLAPILSATERDEFARAMLSDVLEAVRTAGGDPFVLATDPIDTDVPVADVPVTGNGSLTVTVDDRPLTEAVNGVLAEAQPDHDDPLGIVMADLALATPEALEGLFSTDGDVVIVPGRGGGTNALVVRHPAFRVDYHGTSCLDHREAAAAVGARVGTVDSYRLSTDVDDPADLAEVLLHGDGRSRRWLEDAGFSLAIDEGRVDVDRG